MPNSSDQLHADPRKLISRREAAEMLGRSISTVKRMEGAGLLKGKRLTNRPRAMLAYRLTDVLAIIDGHDKA